TTQPRVHVHAGLCSDVVTLVRQEDELEATRLTGAAVRSLEDTRRLGGALDGNGGIVGAVHHQQSCMHDSLRVTDRLLCLQPTLVARVELERIPVHRER